ncbi:hypothetical protein HanRHA438_Chr06g0275571 [Helianthus annuus]|uniref:Uncharacterized protein n=1 Tax=Helianthus annuus TaxID=4232 RepID=A0A9K3IU48_HELAN|nr:hypothetical protein HanXRQr2_Chr06g0266501 [Helianthus annuus]KAJ0561055.1 hypothetical protein HanHA300_Chr06g0218511 [Helianthus annuus]KAJ0567597.1 hypothetical protein HanIR_Chr06g0286671 [Helianthus annuus]KAJ0574093.1 hypothetical protein HanHA89_Chr06g0234261 [Helianthus annuus]KAJ0738428.1 hypothetical protein HanLR1_Chr06g0218191 [Helianthus annuus]
MWLKKTRRKALLASLEKIKEDDLTELECFSYIFRNLSRQFSVICVSFA